MVLLAMGGVLFATVPAAAEEYIQEDAKLAGKAIYTVEQGGKELTVVQDNFELQIGRHVMSGDGAVLWIADTPAGETVRRKIVVYIEGGAKVVEPDGKATTDRIMLVYVNQEGAFTTSGPVKKGQAADLPILARAAQVRKDSESPTTTRPAPVRLHPATGPGSRPATAPATRPTTRPTATGPAEASATNPVSFQAKKVTLQDYTEGGKSFKAVVLKGDVYLSQATEKGELFMEMRAQAAVIFIEKNVPAKDVRSPLSTNVPGLGEGSNVTGVYLENDVVIARGERTMTAGKAYYDFTTDRAMIVDATFRIIQEQRNIPIYIHSKTARALSSREMLFENAQVTTSDFHTPSYAIAAKKVILRDLTPYDNQGQPLGEQQIETVMKDVTYRVEDVPILYWPWVSGDVTEGDSPLRRVNIGHNGRFGSGIESEWDFFRLLGLLKPQGVRGEVELDAYDRAELVGVNFRYNRRGQTNQYTGYSIASYVYDNDAEDEFGDDDTAVKAPHDRGRVLTRNKEFLPNHWELQFELSYLSDKNFLEQFYRDEFFTGKEQETLLYAKKQHDNWAFTSLLQYRLNDFETQTESWPDFGFYLLGEPLADGRLTFFNEDHLGLKRYLASDNPRQFPPPYNPAIDSSDVMGRADTRNEIDMPLKAGPVNITPYVTGRMTGWSDEPRGGDSFRPYGQVGVKNNMDIWRVYNDTHSRLWDINRLKHIITPEVVGWLASTGGVDPDEIFPMDPGIEQNVTSTSGASFGVYQRLQTKRGEAGKQQTVDWMRLDVVASFFDNPQNDLPSDGRFFFSRPEYSLARNAINADYVWNISDATAFLADCNYDVDSGGFGRVDAGLAVQRSPRFRYYMGIREIRDLETTVGTFGFNYKLSTKYSLGFFEQYDFDSANQENLLTTISIIRKFERWYGSLSFEYDRSQGSFGAYITIWPEGVPEAKIGSGRLSPLGSSSAN